MSGRLISGTASREDAGEWLVLTDPVHRTFRMFRVRLPQWILLLIAWSQVLALGEPAAEIQGTLVVVGRGPERPVIEKLAHSFEKAHVGVAVDIKWNRTFRLAEMIHSGEADLAVGGSNEPGLAATIVAWDGLAIMVNFSNRVKDLTTRQAAAIFSGAIHDWSEVDDKASGKIRLVLRPDDQNLSDGFEQTLGINGRLPKDAERIRSDQNVLSRIAGQLDAVGYLSLRSAMEAMTYGLSVRSLLIDGVEAAEPTVRSGTYRLKRPVIFLTSTSPTPIAEAFVAFTLSPEGQRLLDETYVSILH
jgi:phosphate transport system substrate-binding protein